MIEDRFTHMEADELKALLKKRYGFEDDEIDSLFPTDDRMREALREFKQASTRTVRDNEDALGWDQEDDQPLTADQTKAVENKKLMHRKIEQAKKKREERNRKFEEEKLDEAIADAGGQVTPTEVKKSMKDVKKLMEEE